MKCRRSRFLSSSLIFLYCLMFPAASYAYIDPGSGSYFLQMLIGIFIGAAFAIKIYWVRIKSFLVGFLQKGKK